MVPVLRNEWTRALGEGSSEAFCCFFFLFFSVNERRLYCFDPTFVELACLALSCGDVVSTITATYILLSSYFGGGGVREGKIGEFDYSHPSG